MTGNTNTTMTTAQKRLFKAVEGIEALEKKFDCRILIANTEPEEVSNFGGSLLWHVHVNRIGGLGDYCHTEAFSDFTQAPSGVSRLFVERSTGRLNIEVSEHLRDTVNTRLIATGFVSYHPAEAFVIKNASWADGEDATLGQWVSARFAGEAKLFSLSEPRGKKEERVIVVEYRCGCSERYTLDKYDCGRPAFSMMWPCDEHNQPTEPGDEVTEITEPQAEEVPEPTKPQAECRETLNAKNHLQSDARTIQRRVVNALQNLCREMWDNTAWIYFDPNTGDFSVSTRWHNGQFECETEICHTTVSTLSLLYAWQGNHDLSGLLRECMQAIL